MILYSTEDALGKAQELLRILLSESLRKTAAIEDMVRHLDEFLAAYGVDGETDLSEFQEE